MLWGNAAYCVKLRGEDLLRITNTSISAIADDWRSRATRCIKANVLQKKVDAQCDQLATNLSWQRLRLSTFSSYSELFVECRQFLNFSLPHLHLAPSLGVTPFEFTDIFGIRKQESCGLICVIPHLAVSIEHRLVTDRLLPPRKMFLSSFAC